MKKTKLIVVAGPTASGKTALGVEIAKALSGEVISADSMQVYTGMHIATAAPAAAEMQGVAHHLVEFISRESEFSVSDFCNAARAKISEIESRGNTPLIVGGTGLFIDSLVDNISFSPIKHDEMLRQQLCEKSAGELYETLCLKDPQAAKLIHPNNKKRVIRALEICFAGSTKTRQNELSRAGGNPFETLYFIISFNNRQLLYERIDRRVDEMFENGLVDEALKCFAGASKTAAQAIGPKELQPYFRGEITLNEARENIKRQTRRYAKRQITWFKRRHGAVLLPADSMTETQLYAAAIEKSRDFLNEK
ncbi:MAG: tRNA (adenosine(37)-N6)-dimethylallyltransferase MiaA [Clostridiales bacterium]|nr:tRNA (adenosine(37)-N6)-dimethylallyltransferase MiaA [Clostridiales bacterium]